MSRPPRRGRLPRLLVAVLALLVLLIVGDRVALWIAEGQVGNRIQSAEQLRGRPSVSIAGFPFLTQVLANRYRLVQVAADNITVGTSGRTARLARLRLRLTAVRTARDFSSASAQAVDATAVLSYPELSQVLGTPLSYGGSTADGHGRVKAGRSLTLLGRTVTGFASAEVGVSASELTFADVRVGLGSTEIPVPQLVTDELTRPFARPLSLAGLPLRLMIRRITAEPTGVSLSATGADVAIR